MGCVSSKQIIRSRSCKHGNARSKFPRSCSAHVRCGKDDNPHIVSLTSSTLGSIHFTERTKSHNNNNESSHHINGIPGCKRNDDFIIVDNKTEFELGVIEAKEWSQMINRKMNMMSGDDDGDGNGKKVESPKKEPETINAWELMAGLEEEEEEEEKPGIDQTLDATAVGIDHEDNPYETLDSVAVGIDHDDDDDDNPCRGSDSSTVGIDGGSSSSNLYKTSDDHEKNPFGTPDDCDPKFCSARIEFAAGCTSLGRRRGPGDHEPHAAHLEPVGVDEEHGEVILKARVSDVDPEFLSAFKEALEEFSPKNQFHLELQNYNHPSPKHHRHQQREETRSPVLSSNDDHHQTGTTTATKPDQIHHSHGLCVKDGESKAKTTTTTVGGGGSTKERVVLYYTSLRGVRKTYEACCKLRLVLKAMGVRVDERDLSMHSGYKEELRERLGGGDVVQVSKLPQLFLGKRYIGGAEELKQMNEDGRLEQVLDGCEMIEDDPSHGMSPGAGVCEVCGDVRFVPCERCYGSCKIAAAGDDEEGCGGGGGEVMEQQPQHQRCPDCNENGLVRCPFCCN